MIQWCVLQDLPTAPIKKGRTNMATPPPVFANESPQLLDLLKKQNATILAAAIIAASGRPHSIEQALEIVRDIQFAMAPIKSGAYEAWAKTKSERLSKVHGP